MRRPLDNYTLRRQFARTAGRRADATAILAKMKDATLPRLGATDRSWPIEHDRALVGAIAIGAPNSALPAYLASMRKLSVSACAVRWSQLRAKWLPER